MKTQKIGRDLVAVTKMHVVTETEAFGCDNAGRKNDLAAAVRVKGDQSHVKHFVQVRRQKQTVVRV